MFLRARRHERHEHLGGLRAALRDARQAYREASAADASSNGGGPHGRGRNGDRPEVAGAPVPAPVHAAPGTPGPRRWLEDQPIQERPIQGPDPDVVVDVPMVRVDEISLQLDELKARVALDARVLDLLKLNVGVDAELRGVRLDIKGVEAQALLKARLDNLTVILNRVMSTIDANPQILERLTDSLGTTLEEVGSGTRHAVEEIGGGAGHAVEEVGTGAGHAVDEVGRGAGHAVDEVGRGAGGAVEGVGAIGRPAPPQRPERPEAPATSERPEPPTPPTPPDADTDG